MKAAKRDTKGKNAVTKIAYSISFSSDRLEGKKNVSKERQRYVKQVSEEALSAINA